LGALAHTLRDYKPIATAYLLPDLPSHIRKSRRDTKATPQVLAARRSNRLAGRMARITGHFSSAYSFF
jgi:hypothetical protein